MTSLPLSNNNLNQIFFALLPDKHSGQNLGKREKISEIKDLLKFGVNVNAEIHAGYTPICKVIEEGGSKTLIELLLDHGAQIDIPIASGFEWQDVDGKIIKNQLYALARQRTLKYQDKESHEIQQLIHRHLIQHQLSASSILASVLNSHEHLVSSPGVLEKANTSSMASVYPNQSSLSTLGSLGNSSNSNLGSTSYVAGNIYPTHGSYLMHDKHKPNGSEKNDPLKRDHSSLPADLLSPDLHLADMHAFDLPHKEFAKRRIFVFDFENTLVNGHFHNILKNMGVANGRASPDLVSFLFEKYGLKHQEWMLILFRDILRNGDCISIASQSRYPETIYAALEMIGLTPEEKSKIFYDPPDLSLAPDVLAGKNVDLLKAMIHFEIIDVNAIYLIDCELTNLQIAKARLNIPESNLIRVDIEKSEPYRGTEDLSENNEVKGLPPYLQMLQRIVSKHQFLDEHRFSSKHSIVQLNVATK